MTRKVRAGRGKQQAQQDDNDGFAEHDQQRQRSHLPQVLPEEDRVDQHPTDTKNNTEKVSRKANKSAPT